MRDGRKQPGQPTRQPIPYGGVAGRYWLGEPGRSDLIGGSLQVYDQIAPGDQEQVTEELQARLLQEIRRSLHAQTGLVMPVGQVADRIEWLVTLSTRRDTESEGRIRAFLEGWSAGLPPGGARALQSNDIQALARRVWGTPTGGRQAHHQDPEV